MADAEGQGSAEGSPRARSLTGAEKELVWSLLSGKDPPPTLRPLPRSTRQSALARILARDWVQPRVLPHPIIAGWPFQTIAVAQPLLDRVAETVRDWRAREGCVLLWSSNRTLVGVFLSRTAPTPNRVAATTDPRTGGMDLRVTQALAETPVTAYFDFEAAWTKVAGLPGFASYPQGYPGAELANASEPAPSPSEAEALLSAVLTRRVDSRVARRLVERGWLEARQFLNPIALSRDVRDFPTGVTFIHGQLGPKQAASELFRKLVGEVGVTPFLFTLDGSSVLLGALSRGHPTKPDAPSALRGAALAVLREHLTSISVIEEDLREFEVAVDHRYDRLLDISPR